MPPVPPVTSATPDTPQTATAAPAPTSPAPAAHHHRAITLRPLAWAAPARWLTAAAHDLRHSWGVALFYGLCFWGMAQLLGWVFRASPQYTLSMASGCLLLGPFLAMGLYDTSRRLAQGQPPDLGQSLTCWDKHLGSMAMLVLVLVVLELLWGRASLVVFAVFFQTGMPSATGVFEAVFNFQNWEFLLVYACVGGVFAGLVFCTTAVSLPMILDRDTDALTAGITSFRVVLGNLGPMLWWGLLITASTALALWTPFALALIAVGPWLGYASWHAYQEAVAP